MGAAMPRCRFRCHSLPLRDETVFNAPESHRCGRDCPLPQKWANFWPLVEITLSRYYEAVYAEIRPICRENQSPFFCR